MYYYNSEKFYFDLEHFMSDEFQCIRKAFLFDLLPENEQEKLMDYMKSIFSEKFLRLISVLRKKYRADKLKVFLKNFFNNLKLQFKKPKCYIETHDVFPSHKLSEIEEAIKEKFNIKDIRFKYLVNNELLYGISFRLNYKMYDINLNCFLKNVVKKSLAEINKQEV